MIDAPEDWKMPESAPAPHKHPTSTGQDKYCAKVWRILADSKELAKFLSELLRQGERSATD